MPDGTETSAAARPLVRVAGIEAPQLSSALAELVVHAEVDAPARLELTLVDWGTRSDGSVGFLWSDRALVDFGRDIEVALGAAADEGLFAGRVTGLRAELRESAPPRLVVEAHDALWSLQEVRRTRAFEELGDVDAAAVVAAENGLALEADVEADIEHPRIAQLATTDLEFLRERAARLGASLFVRDGVLHLQDAARGSGEELELEFGRGLTSFSPEARLVSQATEVSAVGWDVERGREIREVAAQASANAAGELEPGSEVLRASFGERRVAAELVGQSDAEARRLAQTELAARERRFVTGEGAGAVDARIRPGARVRVRGIGELFEGVYRVLAVRHAFDASQGWSTRFRFERPGAGTAGCISPEGRAQPERPTKPDRPERNPKEDRR